MGESAPPQVHPALVSSTSVTKNLGACQHLRAAIFVRSSPDVSTFRFSSIHGPLSVPIPWAHHTARKANAFTRTHLQGHVCYHKLPPATMT